MAVGGQNGTRPNGHTNGAGEHRVRYVPLAYSSADSQQSALDLVLTIRPEWKEHEDRIEFVRFTDGITNTLLKAVYKKPGLSKDEVDKEAILLRAYGNGTDVIIDRHREAQNHELLMKHGLAPELLARFENGMMYRFIQGSVTHPEDLRKPSIYRAVARRLAQWHAIVPCISGRTGHSRKNSRADSIPTLDSNLGDAEFQRALDTVAPGKPPPNVWTVMQKWIFALPTDTEAQRARQAELQGHLTTLVADLSQRPGLGVNGLVFAHCDLLSGNVIVLPKSTAVTTDKTAETVTFIDYEYATPSPAAFDIANHFAEWGGFDCDFSKLPTRAQRREFVSEYIHAYYTMLGERSGAGQEAGVDEAAETEKLMVEIDEYRGVPGFYWGIWALIQATISKIDFDYASYAETRLGEFYAWRAEVTGERERAGSEKPLRERRWAQDE